MARDTLMLAAINKFPNEKNRQLGSRAFDTGSGLRPLYGVYSVRPHAPTARTPLKHEFWTRIGFPILARISQPLPRVLIRPSSQIEAASRLQIRKLSTEHPRYRRAGPRESLFWIQSTFPSLSSHLTRSLTREPQCRGKSLVKLAEGF